MSHSEIRTKSCAPSAWSASLGSNFCSCGHRIGHFIWVTFRGTPYMGLIWSVTLCLSDLLWNSGSALKLLLNVQVAAQRTVAAQTFDVRVCNVFPTREREIANISRGFVCRGVVQPSHPHIVAACFGEARGVAYRSRLAAIQWAGVVVLGDVARYRFAQSHDNE